MKISFEFLKRGSLWAAFFISGLLASGASAEVVIVGDSLTCGPFGQHVFENLLGDGEQVSLFCTEGSAAIHWLEGRNPPFHQPCQFRAGAGRLELCNELGRLPRIESIVAAHSKARFIIALGTNSMPDGKTDDSYSRVAELVARYSMGCDWIAPPHFQRKSIEPKLDGFYESLKRRVQPSCRVIDSRGATAPGTPGFATTDGIHRGETAGKYWADRLRPQINGR